MTEITIEARDHVCYAILFLLVFCDDDSVLSTPSNMFSQFQQQKVTRPRQNE